MNADYAKATVRSASITGLLQGERWAAYWPNVDHIIEVVRRHADLTEPVTRSSIFDLVKMLVDSQKGAVLAVAIGVRRGQRAERTRSRGSGWHTTCLWNGFSSASTG